MSQYENEFRRKVLQYVLRNPEKSFTPKDVWESISNEPPRLPSLSRGLVINLLNDLVATEVLRINHKTEKNGFEQRHYTVNNLKKINNYLLNI